MKELVEKQEIKPITSSKLKLVIIKKINYTNK